MTQEHFIILPSGERVELVDNREAWTPGQKPRIQIEREKAEADAERAKALESVD